MDKPMDSIDWQKAKEIFNDALELPVNQRAQFLTEKCEDNLILRQEVESLLKKHEESQEASFLVESSQESIKDKIFEILTDRLSIEQKVADRYIIIKKLGKGGMGEVYLAKDLKLSRLIALKVIKEELSQDKNRLRDFEEEAKKAASIDSEHIIRIIEQDESEGISFITSEFFDGITLREKLKTSELKTEELINIVSQVASALEKAHQKNIVHSDIKPENIMINNEDKVKVLDFGIAKLIEPVSTDFENPQNPVVQNETIWGLGTINYMSPEQVRREKIDGRSDIWSLGVCLYEMLTGKKPFADKTDLETQASILKSPPAAIEENIPTKLKEIVEKSLQKKFEDRYQTISEFRSALEKVKNEKAKSSESQNYGMNTFNEWLRTFGKPSRNSLLLCVILCFVISLGLALIKSNSLETTYSDQEISKAREKFEKDKDDPSKEEKDTSKKEKEEAKEILSKSSKEPSKEPSYTEIVNKAKDLAVPRVAKDRRIKTFAEYYQTSASFFHLMLIAIAFFYYHKNYGPTEFHEIERDIVKDEKGKDKLKFSITYSTGYEEISDWRTARDTATTALKDYRDVFVGLLIAWIFLYSIVILSFFFEDNNIITSFLTQANNFNTICLWLCFRILNEPISTENKTLKNKTLNARKITVESRFKGQFKLFLYFLGGVLAWLVAEIALTSNFKDNADIFHKISELVSGLFGGIAMAVLVGRFQSKFLKSPETLVILLYLYTVIQSLFIFFGDNLNVESNYWKAGVIQIALFLKCLLILYMFWLFQSGRLLFYLVRVRRADEQIDREWENFPEVLKQENANK